MASLWMILPGPVLFALGLVWAVAVTLYVDLPPACETDPVPPPTDDAIVPNARRSKASALYGLIIAGAVLATASPTARLGFVALSLVATLAVYWIAETYVHFMAERQAEQARTEPGPHALHCA